MSSTSSTARHGEGVVPPDRVTLKEVRASINNKVPTHIPVKWFGRPVSNLLTPAFYNSGWTANAVTTFRAYIGLVAVATLLGPAPWWPIIGAVGYYICFILDCVDGNLARLRNEVSYWGKFIDGLSDSIFMLLAPFTAGVGIWLNGGPAEFMILGGAIAFVSSTTQMIRSRLSFFREWMTGLTGPIDDGTTARLEAPRRLSKFSATVLVNGTFVVPLLLCIPGNGAILFLLALVAIQFLPDMLWIYASLKEGRIMLQRSRRSVHAAVPEPETNGSKPPKWK